ncbi:polyphosphate kinase 2 family protein [Halotia branconii]|uniref:Polyphosphate kinase 2 family protein n=1 Tax=Halotia branconii CENA392 TaxID=1539056 RepID=A0AAJ6P7U4_9CYAN|nr:polyphosphate kinase 2 family protein [Halotia branconii]WGV24104.1 polyphosphate kinase 2 family protein [Halotia branconii CENA392]
MNHDAFIVPPNSKISLQKDYDPAYKVDNYYKIDAVSKLQKDIQQIANFQEILYAQNIYALLIIFQAMDAAGKDSTIKHVMSGVNPQGFQVFNFQAPSAEELDHDYLWRTTRALPERGRIGIFNRSYYEEVLAVRVHPEILLKQQLPQLSQGNQIWKQRFEEINNFEKYLVNNGVIVLKFFLNVSKSEQKKRFLKRIENPDKHWKFAASDVYARASWDEYMEAYEAVFNHTSTVWAPWYIIPADRKWFTRLVVSDIICTQLEKLHLKYPTVSDEHRQQLLQAKYMLEQED